jgi:hypothetical protein
MVIWQLNLLHQIPLLLVLVFFTYLQGGMYNRVYEIHFALLTCNQVHHMKK